MKLNMIVLVVSSGLQLIFILWHMFRYRRKTVAISFIFFGLLFGILRSETIHFLQITANHSLLPYQLRSSLLQIGNDSLQVYVGWIIAAYYAWCFAEIILKKQKKIFTSKDSDINVFAIISVSFIFIASFCYMVETTASFLGWWSWNPSLSAGFVSSLFVNVPWVGVIDWATVAIEFLGIFLVTWYVKKSKKYIFLLIYLFPLIHWATHLSFVNAYWPFFGSIVTIPMVFYLLIPIFTALLSFIKAPLPKNEIPSYKLVWAALIIGVAVCFLSVVFVGKSAIGLLSLVPILLLIWLALGIEFKKIIYFCLVTILIGLVIFTDMLTRKRLVIVFFPIAYFIFIYLIGLMPKLFAKINKGQKVFIIAVPLILITILGLLTIKSDINQTQSTVNPPTTIVKSKKYVLLVTLDTLRNDHTGLGGYNRNVTPNLDKLGHENVYFSDAYSPIPLTYPAHMSLFTGLYPKSLGLAYNASSVNVNSPTLAELFSDNGYNTAAFISSGELDKNNVKKGFNTFDYKSDNPTKDNTKHDQRQSDETNKLAVSWLDKNAKQPFFLWVHFFDIHSPYDTYCPKSYSVGKSPDNQAFINGYVSVKSPTPTQKDYDYLIARYDEEIACQDQQFGKLIYELKKLGIYNDTNIIVAGDHGENFDHGVVFHGLNLYQSALRVPLIVKINGFNEMNKDKPVLLTDIFPTIIQDFGLADNIKSEGVGLQASAISSRQDLYFQTTSNLTNNTKISKSAVIRNGKDKLIADTLGKKMTNLVSYNLILDENELNNIWDPSVTTQNSLRESLSTFLDN